MGGILPGRWKKKKKNYNFRKLMILNQCQLTVIDRETRFLKRCSRWSQNWCWVRGIVLWKLMNIKINTSLM